MPSPTSKTPITHLLYLHGFRSSPQSTKARQLAAHMAAHHPQVHWWCPQLPPSPRGAMEMLLEGIAGWPRETMAVVGSSLGGFYATQVAEQTGCRAVLVNPAVDPARDLAKYIGEQTSWHDPEERFFFQPEYVNELQTLACGPLTHPERYLAFIAKGDEVLDWREMHARYANSPQVLLEGGDHALSDFESHLPRLLAFLGLV
ncbi:MAG: esterase [Curvibacter sp. RIFCSPHIGHO2_12_FULL_63_18]|uniref:YqiA/YcfP family alpha/beta fold hydrolase n=1 Tax=Rhodoferax sp. TaxID=50421 RepID=UPI0008C291FE|nr:YqiA/YcfP family alpha/beta fold hydrolase [Rhodoferax sp.]OGO97928.1 MAG: esterase [Curvibacter sp. GWA2_63_95]OGO99369.1 MAG: esterase [Curvibacter sp. RIFCSPHIGHO2_12_FULL_63_18]HCX81051.1 esterase [Rhodoferax sp.]